VRSRLSRLPSAPPRKRDMPAGILANASTAGDDGPVTRGAFALISSSRRFVFVHVPRTAGMSMFSVLQPMADVSPLSSIAPRGHRLHSTLREIRAAADVRDFFSFAFVRNPWQRLASLYAFTAAGKADPVLYPEFYAAAGRVRQGGIGDFLRRFADHPLMSPQADWVCLDGEVEVDVLGRFESLRSDWETVCSRIGVDHADLPLSNQSGADDYRRMFTDADAAAAADHFRADVDLFGYQFDDSVPTASAT